MNLLLRLTVAVVYLLFQTYLKISLYNIIADQLHTCTQQLLSELDILTKIHPHENICNLLASCTSPSNEQSMMCMYLYIAGIQYSLEVVDFL